MISVLIVEDEREQEENTRRVLEAALGPGPRIEVARDIAALDRAGREPWSLVVLDKFLRRHDVITWLRGEGSWLMLKWKQDGTPVFLTSTYANPIEDKESLRGQGLVVENWGRSVSSASVAADIARLCGRSPIGGDGCAEWQEAYQKAFGVGPDGIHPDPIWQASTASIQAIEALHQRARDSDPVLLLGETGTGKDLASRYLHTRSGRKGELVVVNCGTLTESLLESELFGHVKGAYTHAQADQIGRIERAEGGTLFLDEAEAMSPKLQAALLRVIEDKEVRKVGASRTRRVDVRFVAASNRELHPKRCDGEFREDLYHRFGSPICLPSWPERVEGERKLLAEHILRQVERETKLPVGSVKVPRDSQEWILSVWSGVGNIRALINLIKNALRIDAECLRRDTLERGCASSVADRSAPTPATPPGRDRGPETILAQIRAWNQQSGKTQSPQQWAKDHGQRLIAQVLELVHRGEKATGERLETLFSTGRPNLHACRRRWLQTR